MQGISAQKVVDMGDIFYQPGTGASKGTHLSRRALLGGSLGVAAASLLSACAPGGTASPAPATSDAGVQNFYIPGTEEGPAKNVPQPMMQPNAQSKSLQGARAFLEFWMSAQNYLLLTGDSAPFIQANAVREETKRFADGLSRMYQTGNIWLISESSTPLDLSLEKTAPYEGPEPNSYIWPARVTINQQAYLFNRERPDKPAKLSSVVAKNVSYVYLTYTQNRWMVETTELPADWKPSKVASF